jgi:hypothetical protein
MNTLRADVPREMHDPASPGTPSRATHRASRIAHRAVRGVTCLAILLLAVPFLAVSAVLLAQIPARLWPDDYATPSAVRDTAGSIPEYPGALIGRPVLDDPTGGRWLGFMPSDLTVETPYVLVRTASVDQVVEFYQELLPELGWTRVRIERTADGVRVEYRRRALGLILTLLPSAAVPGDDTVRAYRVRVGPVAGQSLRR